MKVNDLIQQLQNLVAADPSVGELPLFNQSCFDSPSAYETSFVGLSTAFEVGDERFFVDEDEANAEADVDDAEVINRGRCVVIEAF